MAKSEPSLEPEVDEYGVPVHRYTKQVLVVVPPRNFAETTLRYARSTLLQSNVGTRTVAPGDDVVVEGRLQDSFEVDGPVSAESMSDYVGVIFVGGEGAADLAADEHSLRLAREAMSANKLVATWGEGLEVLLRAGLLKGRKVTGAAALAAEVRSAGGQFTGVQNQSDGNLVTAIDDASGLRLSVALTEIAVG